MYLLSGVLLGILGCNAISKIVLTTPDPNRFPVKSWNITMDLDQREEFFTQMQYFADKRSLELRSTFYDADKKGFFIMLTGDSFHISAISGRTHAEEIRILFFNEASPPTSRETFDELAVDLKNHLKEIPSMIINEKLKRLRIMMDENRTQQSFTELFTRLREFTDQHSIEFTTSSYDSNLETFTVEMSGDGFRITNEVVRSIPGEINIDFYIHYEDNGASTSTSEEIVTELFDDLRTFFGEIPNVTITEGN
jgi:hypothetical protein